MKKKEDMQKPARGLKHFAFFIPQLAQGGAEGACIQIANQLVSRGHKVSIVTVKPNDSFPGVLNNQVDQRILHSRTTFTSVFGLAKFLREEQPDSIVSFLINAGVVLLIARHLVVTSTRFFVSMRGSLENPRLKTIPNRLLLMLLKILSKRSDGYIAVSSHVKTQLCTTLRIPESKVTVIHNPVDLEFIKEMSSRPVLHKWYKDRQIPVICSVGRLMTEKDYPTLLRAIANEVLLDKVHLVILGEGPELGSLKSLASELGVAQNVEFVGFQKNPINWMAQADLFVLSSATEGMPNALIQALATDVPIVSTDCISGPSEILEGGRFGKLVEVGNSSQMASAIHEQLNASNKQTTVHNQRATRFDASKIIDQYEYYLAS